MHAWEIGPNYFQYYFFDENCAYHLLGLLQVARPELDLTSQFRWWSIPSDAVKEIARQPGIVKKVVYRPASATVVRYRLDGLKEQELRLVKDLSTGKITVDNPALLALPNDRAAAVFEASQDYIGYRRAIGKDDLADPAGLEHELLAARSRLDVVAQETKVPEPNARPDQGHGSSRVTVGVGRKDGINYQELSARATYHDIMDSDQGYIRGAQIEFFSLGLRHYNLGSTGVEKFTPVNILSLTPRDNFFQSLSWKISAGWQRVRIADNSEPLAFSLDGGAGGAWSNKRNTTLLYALFDNGARLNRNLSDGYALGAGADAGAILDIGPRWRLHGFVKGMRYFMGQRDTPYTIGIEQRISLARDLALRLDFMRNRELQRNYNIGSMSMLYYF